MKGTAIISGRYPATKFESSINHKVYADKYDYTYIHCNWPNKVDNYYNNKIAYILNYIDLFDYIIWIDDDAFFFDLELDIMEYAPKGDNFISACKSPSYKELFTFFSSGQFILKCNKLAKEFLTDVFSTRLTEVKDWWNDSLGFFTNGDQDAMVYQFHQEKYSGHQLFDYKCFNSRPENLFGTDPHKPFILHFTGKPEIKEKNYKLVQKEFDLPPSLIETDYLKDYKLYSPHKINALHKIKRWLSN